MSETTKYVIHDHHAKRAGHHFDLRILKDDVLKSWAIPKARLPKKGERLLAIRVPDHHKDYISFEGNIDDTYGKGTVSIFDDGVCIILKWSYDKIGFVFKGKKSAGMYWLLKMAGKKQTKNWLLIRGKK